jgi:predicted nucleic acid-binding protein
MAFVVIYDACVLYPAPLRDFLIRLAANGVVRARWSATIIDEVIQAIRRRRPDLDPGKLDRTAERMACAVRDCLVTGFEPLIASLTLPDAHDRHVLAAAIVAQAQAIVTANLKDFPAEALAPFQIEARHPDDFVLDQLDLAPARVVQVVVELAAALRNPPATVDEVIERLARNGLAQSMAKIRELRGDT